VKCLYIALEVLRPIFYVMIDKEMEKKTARNGLKIAADGF
jgi:hypothetical protein